MTSPVIYVHMKNMWNQFPVLDFSISKLESPIVVISLDSLLDLFLSFNCRKITTPG